MQSMQEHKKADVCLEVFTVTQLNKILLSWQMCQVAQINWHFRALLHLPTSQFWLSDNTWFEQVYVADFTEQKYGTQNKISTSKFCGVTEQRVRSKTGQNDTHNIKFSYSKLLIKWKLSYIIKGMSNTVTHMSQFATFLPADDIYYHHSIICSIRLTYYINHIVRRCETSLENTFNLKNGRQICVEIKNFLILNTCICYKADWK
jgi:hypothetical protein